MKKSESSTRFFNSSNFSFQPSSNSFEWINSKVAELAALEGVQPQAEQPVTKIIDITENGLPVKDGTLVLESLGVQPLRRITNVGQVSVSAWDSNAFAFQMTNGMNSRSTQDMLLYLRAKG